MAHKISIKMISWVRHRFLNIIIIQVKLFEHVLKVPLSYQIYLHRFNILTALTLMT